MTCLSPLVRILTKIPPFESWESLTSKVFFTFYKVPHLPTSEFAYLHSFCWPSGFSPLSPKTLPIPDHDSLLPSPYPLTPRSCLCLLNAEIKGVVKHNQLSPLFVLYKCLLLHSVFSTECMKAVCAFVNVWTHKSRRVWKRLHWMFWKWRDKEQKYWELNWFLWTGTQDFNFLDVVTQCKVWETCIIVFKKKPGVVAHTFNHRLQEAEAGRFLSSRPAWSTKWVPEQPEIHRETLSPKKQQQQKHIRNHIIDLRIKYKVHNRRLLQLINWL